jgi:hypothetical protein
MVFQVYENQENSSQEIVDIVSTNNSACMVLLAQMQSGKTGTYLKAAIECILHKKVEHVIIISGSRDTSLRAQTKSDLEQAIIEQSTETIDGKLMIDTEIKQTLAKSIRIYWSQDLKQGKGPETIPDKTLIIHDESHSAQSKNNKPYEDFYKYHEIEKALYGDLSQIDERHIYLLSVSATPFSELIADEYVKQDILPDGQVEVSENKFLTNKSFIYMEPGKGYIGVGDLIKRCIKFLSKKISLDDSTHIRTVLKQNKQKYNQSYCIIRTNGAQKDQPLMMDIARSNDYEYISVFATKVGESASESLEFLKTKPQKQTVVHICGKARMGQVLDKTHIAMVYEQAENPNTDTILQGLLGRMCGYYKPKDIDIYISKLKQEEIETYVEAWNNTNFEKLTEIKKALNVIGSYTKNPVDLSGNVIRHNGYQYTQIVPIEISFEELEAKMEESIEWKQIKSIQITEHIRDLLKQKKEKDITAIVDYLNKYINGDDTCRLGYRNAMSESYKKYDYMKRFETSCNQGQRDSVDFHEDNWLQLVGCKQDDVYNPRRTMYLIGYIPHSVEDHGNAVFNLPKIDEKCNFIPSIVLPGGLEVPNFNGGQLITFPFDKTANDLTNFEKTLCEFVERTIPGDKFIEGCQRSVTSMFDESSDEWIGVYLSNKMVNATIIKNIEKRFNETYPGIDMKFIKHKGNTNKRGYKQYDAIQW